MKKTDIVHLRVRVRGDLLSDLRAEAKRSKVPVNTDVVKRLEASFGAVSRLELHDLLVQFKQDRDAAHHQTQALLAEIERLTSELKRAQHTFTGFIK